jgi:hypothetical protein
MPIANIVDRRKRQYRSCPITAVIEPSCVDNDMPFADQYDINEEDITTCFEERPNTSLYLAINWANTFKFPVTLYVYDFDRDEEQQAELKQIVKEFNEELERLSANDI